MLSVVHVDSQEQTSTRKSSCVNARGIPTAAYQVLHLLSYRGGGGGRGYPILDGGYPPVLTWDQSLGYPPERTWDQWKYYGMEMGYPWKGHGTSGSHYGIKMGYPPPPGCEQTENITSRLVLRTRSVKYLVRYFQEISSRTN